MFAETLSRILLLTVFIYKSNGLRVTIEGCDLLEHDEKVIQDVYVSCGFINKTTRALNLRCTIADGFDPDTMVEAKFFIRFGNKYRASPIKIEQPLRSILEAKFFDLPNLFTNYCEPPMKYPLKGQYTVTNYTVDSSNYPKMPTGNYKLLVHFRSKGKLISTYEEYIKVEN